MLHTPLSVAFHLNYNQFLMRLILEIGIAKLQKYAFYSSIFLWGLIFFSIVIFISCKSFSIFQSIDQYDMFFSFLFHVGRIASGEIDTSIQMSEVSLICLCINFSINKSKQGNVTSVLCESKSLYFNCLFVIPCFKFCNLFFSKEK